MKKSVLDAIRTIVLEIKLNNNPNFGRENLTFLFF